MSSEAKTKIYLCKFCEGKLGEIEHQEHSNPQFAEYRTCLKCGYQWAKQYWDYLDFIKKYQVKFAKYTKEANLELCKGCIHISESFDKYRSIERDSNVTNCDYCTFVPGEQPDKFIGEDQARLYLGNCGETFGDK